jgi:hypothetical protein
VYASIPEAKRCPCPEVFINFILKECCLPTVVLDSEDSLIAVNHSKPEFIKTRFTKLIRSDNLIDTIRKPGEGNNDVLKKNSLSTLKAQGENNFITRNIFSLVIKDNPPLKEQMAVNSALYFAPFAGNRIGKIRFLQLDVFGTSLLDTLQQATAWVERTANVIHMNSTKEKLRMQLLFSSGEKVNPQLMAENEKIIRDLPYIQDVAILLSSSLLGDDLVDVLVIVREKFEYGISGSWSSTSSELLIVDQNIFGLGNQFSAGMVYNSLEKPDWGGSFNYEISDLGGKFIRTGLGFTNTYRQKGWNAYLDKQFIAAKNDWAGGISFQRVFTDYYLTTYAYTRLDTAASYLNVDMWYGRQFITNNLYSALGNLTVAGRYLHQDYYTGDNENSENTLFRNHDFFVGSIGISKRHLFKNNRIYGYGITEDIPYGRYAEIAMGLDIDSDKARPYFHFRYSKATILKGGAYFKWEVGMGGFLNNSEVEQGVLLLSTNSFTNFIYINHHPYRFFFDMELLSGFNRFKEEYLVINRRFGIRDYFSLDTKGTN